MIGTKQYEEVTHRRIILGVSGNGAVVACGKTSWYYLRDGGTESTLLRRALLDEDSGVRLRVIANQSLNALFNGVEIDAGVVRRFIRADDYDTLAKYLITTAALLA
jgi:hypothetical protein